MIPYDFFKQPYCYFTFIPIKKQRKWDQWPKGWNDAWNNPSEKSKCVGVVVESENNEDLWEMAKLCGTIGELS